MDSRLQRATPDDLKAVMAFYEDVMDRTPGIADYAQWRKGKHPTEKDIEGYIRKGSMYLYREKDIVGAMALTMFQDAAYHVVDWAEHLDDHEVAAIHILAVCPDKQGEGIGAQMVREAISMAQHMGMKAVRLDATSSNTPVHRLYERLGFTRRGEHTLFAENVGWLDFCFFEYEFSGRSEADFALNDK